MRWTGWLCNSQCTCPGLDIAQLTSVRLWNVMQGQFSGHKLPLLWKQREVACVMATKLLARRSMNRVLCTVLYVIWRRYINWHSAGDGWINESGGTGTMMLQGRIRSPARRSCPLTLCPSETRNRQTVDRTRSSASIGRQLTALAMAWPTVLRLPTRSKRFIHSQKHPDRLWGSPSLVFSRYRRSSCGITRWRPDADHLPTI